VELRGDIPTGICISCDARLLNELLETVVEDYVDYLRMTEQTFNLLAPEFHI
jgi:hypothetical protein